ncbi:MAG: hypothetical protein BAJALOKI3v1_140028 [Promethearchaeota archaeon]|jgi:NAD(P)-dependent dehydrogenase (short-subunit alcohol dehydrogenase family)|nr:MAG: hypothetical protein BAJALOKI3v1_140028 [Candidatus Lokiarchaeota archaeon]
MDIWDKTYSVNIRGAIFAIKTFLPYILQQNQGVIVNTTSGGGTPFMTPYFASRAVLTSIGESLAGVLDETKDFCLRLGLEWWILQVSKRQLCH